MTCPQEITFGANAHHLPTQCLVMDLYLGKVVRPQAHDNYRVVLRDHGTEFEIGSIGVQHGAGCRLDRTSKPSSAGPAHPTSIDSAPATSPTSAPSPSACGAARRA